MLENKIESGIELKTGDIVIVCRPTYTIKKISKVSPRGIRVYDSKGKLIDYRHNPTYMATPHNIAIVKEYRRQIGVLEDFKRIKWTYELKEEVVNIVKARLRNI